MRDFTKNLFSFSWAMTLFGARQIASLVTPQQGPPQGPGQAPGAAEAFDSVTDAVVRQFGANLRQTFDFGDRLQGEVVDALFRLVPGLGGAAGGQPAAGGTSPPPWSGPPGGLVPPRPGTGRVAAGQPAIFNAHTTANETVLITYTVGQGTFSADRQYIALHNQLYNLDGTENGLHQGVWQALFKSPADLLSRPAPPTGPMDQPVGPVGSWPVSANTIARWTHADGSSITSVGPAASHLIPLSDGSYLFLVITGQIITGGTGRFAGAHGLTQSLGGTHVPAGSNLFSPQGPTSFPALTLDTFKFVLVGSGGGGSSAAGGGGYAAAGGGGSPASSPSPSPAAAGRSQAEPAACAVTPDPSESKFVRVLGSRMHYIDTGSGEPILFLHGNPVWSYIWAQVLPQVSPTARCIAPDLIGMGLSDKPPIKYTFFDQVRYVEGFIRELRLRNYTMVLHDQGCLIGFYIAMRQERNVRGLAFFEAMLEPYATWADFPQALAPEFKKFRDPVLGPELIVGQNVFIEQVLPASTMVPFTAQQMDCYRLPFLDPPSRRVILQFVDNLPVAGQPASVARATGHYAAWLQRTRLPKLFLWTEPGIISSPEQVEWARRHYQNLETPFLGKGLHFHQQEHPVELGREVARWHQELTGCRPCRGRSSTGATRAAQATQAAQQKG
jgi:haloalkane dehalogenase